MYASTRVQCVHNMPKRAKEMKGEVVPSDARFTDRFKANSTKKNQKGKRTKRSGREQTKKKGQLEKRKIDKFGDVIRFTLVNVILLLFFSVVDKFIK